MYFRIDRKENMCQSVPWIHPLGHTVRQRTLVNKVIKHSGSMKCRTSRSAEQLLAF
jgi:hypothetical protein